MRIRAHHVRSVALAAGVAVTLCVPLAISVAAGADDTVLITRGRPAIASSNTGAEVAARANDASTVTRWASVTGPGTQWVRIDLGSVQRIERVRLTWASTYARTYRVQASIDGSNWTDLYATYAGNGGADDLKRLSGNGRYLRVLATQRARTSGGYALRDVRAYGPAAKVLPAAAPATGSLVSGLEDTRKKERAMQLVSSAENSTLTWRHQFAYIEDIGDGRGYTAGIVGFTSGTSDMLAVVTEYTRRKPGNGLAKYLPALRAVNGSDSHAGLDPGFPAAWRAAAADPVMQRVQENARDTYYFNPALRFARADGLRALGQFAYFDAAVMHGVSGLRAIRAAALRTTKTPAQGGDELAYLNAFLNARVAEMRTEEAHSDVSRVETAQRMFLRRSNLDLTTPLNWKVYGDAYRLAG
ncbi:chitosanase [Paractinoplanes lichenicola]|uniref:Chitosanase n=1 Tax=Paractinoplanes lichenicola TaxID=2802976 RepID=A0ABS1VK45_9ACTN|nr:chitosanase [Actinoplanes lichenicola]MBL7255005.1 chitosanase [Actinoplanes lichenicola]